MSTTPDLPERFAEYIAKHSLFHRGDSILAAVSGGIDSMVMLALLNSLRESWKLTVSVVHLNHQLRGEESAGDEEFVRRAASDLGLRFYTKSVDTAVYAEQQHSSLQEAAREIRYRFFDETRNEAGADALATAHQADDNAETVLMNAIRGAGIRGLSGIPLRREPAIIRPLLFAYREEIRSYAFNQSISYREDSSNASLKYLRNFIRNRVFPELKAHSDAPHALNRLSEMMRSLATRIDREIQGKKKELLTQGPSGSLQITLSKFLKEPLYLQEEFILSVLRTLKVEPSAEKVSSVIGLCSHQTGRSLKLSGSVSVSRNRATLVFERGVTATGFLLPVEIGGNYKVGNYHFSLQQAARVPKVFGKTGHSEFIDAKNLGSRLILRSWKPGDRFVPLGMKASKKLSDFFTDQKVSLGEKSHTPILESDGTIVWVCGKRLDDRFKVTPTTRKAIKLTFRPLRAQ